MIFNFFQTDVVTLQNRAISAIPTLSAISATFTRNIINISHINKEYQQYQPHLQGVFPLPQHWFHLRTVAGSFLSMSVCFEC